MSNSPEHDNRIANLTFASVYPHYLNKIEKKGRTIEELLQIINWLTGYNEVELNELIEQQANFHNFFEGANLNPKSYLITGQICGYRIEEITNELTRNVRYLDKIIDELSKGKKLEKIMRD